MTLGRSGRYDFIGVSVAINRLGTRSSKLYRTGEVLQRAKQALEQLGQYDICPRDCGVDRLADKTATSKTGRYVAGAGIKLFTRLKRKRHNFRNSRCVFCQNFGISQAHRSLETPPEQLARMMLELQDSRLPQYQFLHT